MNFNKKCALVVVTAALSMGSMKAFAQLEEIIVTATKSEKTLQEVPVAVSVIGADEIVTGTIDEFMDLKQLDASLDTRTNQTSANSTVYIRGFGGGGQVPGTDPGVAIMVDGVYRSRITGALDDLPMVEQIEILRGPQNTLFGKSASAGAINIKTRKPSPERSTQISLTTGNYGRIGGKFYATGALTENISASVSGSSLKRDGFYENAFPTAPGDVNDRDRSSARLDIAYDPTNDLSIRFIYDSSESNEACCSVANAYRDDNGAYQAFLAAGSTIPNFGSNPDAPWAGKTYYNFLPSNSNSNEGASLHIDKKVDWGTISTMTAYRTNEYSTDQDVDFDTVSFTNSGTDMLEVDSFQQEIRLTVDSENIDWTAGLFYSNESMTGKGHLTFGPAAYPYFAASYFGLAVSNFMQLGMDPATAQATAVGAGLNDIFALLAGPFGAFVDPQGKGYTSFFEPGQGVFDTATQAEESLSLFLQADAQLTDNLSLLLGVSHLRSDKDASLSQIHDIPYSKIPAAVLDSAAPSASALQYLTPQIGFPNAGEDGQLEDQNTDYTIKLSYEISDSLSVYGGVATGYKTSSFDLVRDVKPSLAEISALGYTALNNPFNLDLSIDGQRYALPEETTVYEIGAKIQFENGYVNLTYFDQETENFQVRTFVGGGYQFSNAPLQYSKGLEFDSAFALSENLAITLSGIVHDPLYGEGHFVDGIDLSGTKPSRVAEQRFTGSLVYKFEIGGFENAVRISALSESDYYTLENPQHRAILSRNGAGEASKNVIDTSLEMKRGAGSVTFWAKNILEEEWIETAFINPGTDAGGDEAAIYSMYHSNPRTVGATLSYSF